MSDVEVSEDDGIVATEGDFAEAPPARFTRAVAGFEKPMVAAVQGLAVGIGATMLLHCDLVFAAPHAALLTPFVDLGLAPEAGSSAVLPTFIGYQRAAALLLLGEPMSADQAVAAGLVNALVQPDARRLPRGDRGSFETHMHREQAAIAAAVRFPQAREAFDGFFRRRRRPHAAGST
nr:enoyl-CoA hydratase-related protein [uncultured Lichenicoccus sp.]